MGAKSLGGPVSLEKSVAVARKVLAAQDLADAIQLEEGSGLSRGNRFTARGLAKVLNLFAPHMGLLESDMGASYKTGTLEGVRTLAGYVSSSRHGPVRFVICAQRQQRRDALRAAQGDRVGALVRACIINAR